MWAKFEKDFDDMEKMVMAILDFMHGAYQQMVMKRCLGNLVDNAIKCDKCAKIDIKYPQIN